MLRPRLTFAMPHRILQAHCHIPPRLRYSAIFCKPAATFSLGGDAAPYFAGPLPHFYGGVTAPYFASPLPHSPGGITPPYFASPLPSPAARHGTTACATSGKPGPSTTRYSGARFCGASGREHGGARQELHGCPPAILRSIQGIQRVQGKLSSGCRNVPPEKYIRHKIWDLVRRP